MLYTVYDISDRAAVRLRTVRYVIDHDLVRGVLPQLPGRGKARTYDGLAALRLAIAAALLEAGYTGEFVAAQMLYLADLLPDICAGKAKKIVCLPVHAWPGHIELKLYLHRLIAVFT